ncbi:MAG: hypothetical protein R3A52_31115 [Polyangiales bacterium]
MAVSDKLRAVRAAIGMLEKQFGKGSVMTLGEDDKREPCAVIPSGSAGIDLALGVGGYPRGRIVEVFGPEARARPRSPSTPSPRRSARAAWRPSSTPSTRST